MIDARKEFTFDLDTRTLKVVFGERTYTKAYNELFDFFCKKHEFEHRQGSVYCSNEPMSDIKVYNLLNELKHECAWIKSCVTRMDVADIGNVHELTEWITNEAVNDIKHELASLQFVRDVKNSKFNLSDKLIEKYQMLTESRESIVSLEKISEEYRLGSTDKLINAIGDELKAQEMQRIEEAGAAPEI